MQQLAALVQRPVGAGGGGDQRPESRMQAGVGKPLLGEEVVESANSAKPGGVDRELVLGCDEVPDSCRRQAAGVLNKVTEPPQGGVDISRLADEHGDPGVGHWSQGSRGEDVGGAGHAADALGHGEELVRR
ncbi:MAG: hypothetical protein ACFCVG_00840 [Kineosporiaceae bacterium]